MVNRVINDTLWTALLLPADDLKPRAAEQRAALVPRLLASPACFRVVTLRAERQGCAAGHAATAYLGRVGR